MLCAAVTVAVVAMIVWGFGGSRGGIYLGSSAWYLARDLLLWWLLCDIWSISYELLLFLWLKLLLTQKW